MGAMTRSQHRRELQEGLNTVFGVEYRSYPEQWKELYETSTESNKAYIEDLLVIGLGGAQVKAEGEAYASDEGGEGWVSRYMFETIGLSFTLTEEAKEDNLYGDLGARYSKSLARSMQHTKNVKGAAVYNNAFNASFAGGDGVALCANNHPLWNGDTASNVLPANADLSETSLEDMMILLGRMKDDRGLLIPVSATKLIVPNELQFIAERIVKAPSRPGTADNDVNALRTSGALPGGYTVNKYLTDPDAFFLRTDVPDSMRFIQRVSLKTKMYEDDETGNVTYRARERYAFGYSNWRGLIGAPG